MFPTSTWALIRGSDTLGCPSNHKTVLMSFPFSQTTHRQLTGPSAADCSCLSLGWSSRRPLWSSIHLTSCKLLLRSLGFDQRGPRRTQAVAYTYCSHSFQWSWGTCRDIWSTLPPNMRLLSSANWFSVSPATLSYTHDKANRSSCLWAGCRRALFPPRLSWSRWQAAKTVVRRPIFARLWVIISIWKTREKWLHAVGPVVVSWSVERASGRLERRWSSMIRGVDWSRRSSQTGNGQRCWEAIVWSRLSWEHCWNQQEYDNIGVEGTCQSRTQRRSGSQKRGRVSANLSWMKESETWSRGSVRSGFAGGTWGPCRDPHNLPILIF